MTKTFIVSDIDTKMIVEETTRKDILGYIDEHLENIKYGNDMSDYSFCILYKDGSTDEVYGNDYDGHKIKRINILSVVVNNPCTSITYGNYSINQYGVVNSSDVMEIDNNIIEVINRE